ncbi:MAG: hypothetical protein HQK79_13460 [Desulfobacterales bacterium]|nr:hypothetical protein [Desulfobacterales bacterium]MBF0395979.1 hypothetical protein [Desulfobacterales bacterium]
MNNRNLSFIEVFNDIDSMEVFGNICDLRRDLQSYISYVKDRDIKRSFRENSIPKLDAKKLAKILTDQKAAKEVETYGTSNWLNYVDTVALKLGWVNYDTVGTYLGYSSSEPSFPDNYIIFQQKNYEAFMAMSLWDQEQKILKILIEDNKFDKNEFFHTSVLGKLEPFSSWGCATGVIPFLNFPASRWFILDILKQCQASIWYSTSSLISYIKEKNPYFLIPQNPKFKDKSDKFEGRYCNFHESKTRWGHEISIKSSDINAFERVEGRYIERFLEGIPLSLGYVDIAYDPTEHKTIYPSLLKLKAFKVSDKFLKFINKTDIEPKVTVCPNFEIHVESIFYPTTIISKLEPISEIISIDNVTILKLKQKKVESLLAKDPKIDVIFLLSKLSGQVLPENIITEIKEWAGHSEVFTLYEGFGLLEIEENIPLIEQFILEEISPNIKIVHSLNVLFDKLERAEFAPLLIEHGEDKFTNLIDDAQTFFPKKSKEQRELKKNFNLKRSTNITLFFPDNSLLEKARELIIQSECPIEVDLKNKSISYSSKHKTAVESAVLSLQRDYTIHFEDI